MITMVELMGMCESAEERKGMALITKGKVNKKHNHKISYNEKERLYWTRVGKGRKGSKRIHAKTEDLLYARLYEYYYPDEAKELVATMRPDEAAEELSRMTFGEALKQWNDWNHKVLMKSAGTHDRNSYTIKFFDELADRPMADLTADDLRRLFAEKAPTTKYYAIKAAVQAMHNTYAWAIEHGVVTKDVSWTIKSTNYQAFCGDADPDDSNGDADDDDDDDDENGRIFSPEQVVTVVDAASRRKQRKSRMRGYAVRFASLTGMRIGEIAALHWSDVHWKEGYIYVHRQQRAFKKDGKRILVELPYTKNEAKKKPKERKGRRFPIYCKELRELLEELRLQTGNGDYIFAEDGNWIDKQSFGRFLYKLLKQLDLYSEDLHGFHAFRRSFNSNVLLRSNLTIAEICYIMGHTPETNGAHYSETQPGRVNEIGQEIARIVA